MWSTSRRAVCGLRLLASPPQQSAPAALPSPLLRALLLTPRRGLAITGRASKNVANKKNKADAAKSKLYARLSIKILMAAKKGTDATQNQDLARALKEAQANKLPKENVERALKKAGDKSSLSDYSTGVYEVLAHGGVGIVVCTLSDNSNRAVKLIKERAGKSEAKFTSGGSVLFAFHNKGVLRADAAFDQDQVIEVALNSEIDDVDFLPSVPDDVGSMIVTSPECMIKLQDALSEAGIVTKADLEFLPQDLVDVTSEIDVERNLDLIECLEDIEDVDAVYHNMKI